MISFRAHFKVLSILITAGIVFSVSGWGAPAQRERRPAALDSSLFKAMEVEPELRELFQVPQPLRLLWIVPIGHAQSWPKAKPRRKTSDFVHQEVYNPKKLRADSEIRPWPKG